ncbi:class I SAM-dependent methyltransferase [Mycoplasma procyoni]|uniref:class I SAM-dependent methyltransferase n=1 Tax=Mycoplasma procyoni TaxID=568784 RepID=UPI00197C8F00|nr:class I SAM-dependent methyltransferase [Mycoplasma procyoni]MBN3534854.1 class I SAM-dependent methyltransferase [Mycoplasma procyoni]
MNNNNKKVFHDLKTIIKYSLATLKIGLWKSETFFIKKYLKNKETKILDLGCGSGRTTFGMYQLGYKNIAACDISSSMIEQANILNEQFKYNILFETQDATELKYKDNSFDFVLFSFNGFPGIPSQKARIKALQEIYRVLKKDGIFIFSAHERDEQKYREYFSAFWSKCPEFSFETKGDYIYINDENSCDFMHLYSIEELKQEIKQNTDFSLLEIVNRDQNFFENSRVKEFSDNTIFWILKKE